MVSDVAPELRTPLTNIRSWLEAAQDGLAAADAGSLRLHPEPAPLGDLLAQVVQARRRLRPRATGGSGLGFSIARKLAQVHGGDITVARRLGAGSVFTIRLPGPFSALTSRRRPS